jgi:carbohydrate kinase (thermoresistant glucokinase family)
MVIVVMGVSGAGKTTVGRALARRLGWPFHEGDDLHPGENVRKMQRDEPLTDEDRRPWLERIRDLALREASRGRNAVVTCSCLKRAYRDVVRGPDVRFLYLAIDRETAAERVGGRRGHFFDAALVASQFQALEPPRRALSLDATLPVEELVDAAIAGLGLAGRSSGQP